MSRDSFTDRLPKTRLESSMEDLKPAYNRAEAVAEANRCLYCHDAPCIQACPTGIDIPEFIRRIATGNATGSAKTIMESNILGFSCARVCPVEVLCAGACVYVGWGRDPIQIGRLQRFATDGILDSNTRFYTKGTPTGKRVALIGGGPASLACAHELVRQGHEAVIFEGRDLPGGLNTTGVAPYKLKAEDALREVKYILEIGIEMKTGVWVGKDVSFPDLEKQYDAIFIGVGLGLDSRLKVPGSDLPGCMGAVELIEKIKNLPPFDMKAKTALVIGGGNTAIDVVRELKRCGVERVVMVYRRSEQEMGAYDHEYTYAKKESVEFLYQATPVALEGDGKVERARLCRMRLGSPDESGRRRPEPVPGSEFTMDTDLVVEAVGQEKLTGLFSKIHGLEVSRGRVVVNPTTGRTSHPKYWAGGDCVNGGKEVVNAAAEGKRAAASIHEFLTPKA